MTTLGRLFEAKSLSASDTSESKSFLIDGDLRFLADSAVGYVSASLFYFNDLSDSPVKAMFLIKDCRTARRGSLVLEVPLESTSVSSLRSTSSVIEEVSSVFIFEEFLKDNSITQLTVLRSTLKTECSGSRAVSHVTH